jgi:hypothetical protein
MQCKRELLSQISDFARGYTITPRLEGTDRDPGASSAIRIGYELEECSFIADIQTKYCLLGGAQAQAH